MRQIILMGVLAITLSGCSSKSVIVGTDAVSATLAEGGRLVVLKVPAMV